MKEIFCYVIIFVCSIFYSVKVQAEGVNDESFRFMSKDDGLAGETVSRVMEDHKGNMWIATNRGVNLFNGKRMITFQVKRTDDNPNYVFDICESERHDIYVATAQGVFEKKTGQQFQRILNDILRAEAILNVDGKLYVGNRNGLYVYDGSATKLITVSSSRVALENGVRDIVADDKGNVWFLSRYALNCYVPATGKFTSYRMSSYMPSGSALSQIAIWRDKFYIGTKNNGLYVCSLKDKVPHKVAGIGNVVTSLYATSKGEVCVSTDGGGAFLLDGNTARIKETYNMRAESRYRLPSDAVYYFTKDHSGNNWFGFYRFGLAYSYYSAPIFSCYRFGSFSSEGLNVRSSYIDKDVKLLGTTDGLFYIDERRNVVKHLTVEMLEGAHFITHICRYNGLFYLGTYDAGLKILDPRNFVVSRLPNVPLLTTTTIASLTVSPDHKLWIGSAEGLFVLDQQGHVERLRGNRGATVTGIIFDKMHNGWVCSEGVALYASSMGTFENTNFPKGFFHNERGLMCTKGHDGWLYFNSKSKIYYTDWSMQHFGQLQLPEELSHSICYSFLDDMKGSYWYATDNGLFRTDYKFSDLLHFGYGEGLICQFVNVDGIKQDGKGDIWLATPNGLLKANRKALHAWLKYNRFPLSMYDIRKGSDLLSYDEEEQINENHRLAISWNLVSTKVAFKVLLQDFAHPFGRLYQYKLDGDKNWNSLAEGNEILLEHLFLGKHKLCLRLMGVPATEATYEVVVAPSWLAILELITLIVAIVLFFIWHRYHHNTKVLLEERNEIEGALLEVEQEQQNAEIQAILPKYSRVKIDEQESGEIVARMKAYIEQNKSYRNPDLKMSDLADVLGLSSSKLSQIFNLYLKENYYEFINSYRLDEFKRLIDEGEYTKYTLTALSEKCGFKKSNFYSTFRRIEGMTPMEYLKKLKIKL